MFHVKHFPPVKSLLAACRGADFKNNNKPPPSKRRPVL